MKNARRQLAELGELSHKTESTEKRILDAAERRLDIVQARLHELQGSAIIDKGAGAEYQNLVLERGRLDIVIAQSKKILSA